MASWTNDWPLALKWANEGMSYKNIAYQLDRTEHSVRSKFGAMGYLRRTHTLPGETVHRLQFSLSQRLWSAVLDRARDRGVTPVGYIRALVARDTGVPSLQPVDVKARYEQRLAQARERYKEKVGGTLIYSKGTQVPGAERTRAWRQRKQEKPHAVEDAEASPHDAGRSA